MGSEPKNTYGAFLQRKQQQIKKERAQGKFSRAMGHSNDSWATGFFKKDDEPPAEETAKTYARVLGLDADAEWEEWQTAWEIRFQQEDPAVTAVEDQSRGKRFRNPKLLIPSVLGTAVLAVVVVLAVYPGKHPPPSSCTLVSCRGKDPNGRCDEGLQNIAEQDRKSPGPITVQVHWNSKCQAAWAKAWGDYVKPGDKVTVTVKGGASESSKVNYGTDQHTAMVPRTETQRVRACWERGHDQVCTSWTPA